MRIFSHENVFSWECFHLEQNNSHRPPFPRISCNWRWPWNQWHRSNICRAGIPGSYCSAYTCLFAICSSPFMFLLAWKGYSSQKVEPAILWPWTRKPFWVGKQEYWRISSQVAAVVPSCSPPNFCFVRRNGCVVTNDGNSQWTYFFLTHTHFWTVYLVKVEAKGKEWLAFILNDIYILCPKVLWGQWVAMTCRIDASLAHPIDRPCVLEHQPLRGS